MRVKLIKKDRERLFTIITSKGKSWSFIALNNNISTRTLNDWRNGKITIPENSYKWFVKFAGLKKNDLTPKIVPDFWHTRIAGQKGGDTRYALYGNFGTLEGRSRGGISSIEVNKNKKTKFIQRKSINKPRDSERLAELLGILIGDGHLSEYQASITTNSETDVDHAEWMKNLIESLFGIKVKVTYRKDELTITLTTSSKNLTSYLVDKGMPIGNKISSGLHVPNWIKVNPLFGKAFIRGLFDTDGCVYMDSHKNSKDSKVYKHIGVAITSYSTSLRSDIIALLKGFGFNPTNSINQKSVYLRRQNEVIRFFIQIGSHNQKHLQRYLKFRGEVPKWS